MFNNYYSKEIEYPDHGTIRIVNRKELPPRTPNTIRIAIDRPFPLGNPFRIGVRETRTEVIQKYRFYLRREMAAPGESGLKIDIDRIHKAYLDGKDVQLVCNCHPLPCHGDVIKEIVEAL